MFVNQFVEITLESLVRFVMTGTTWMALAAKTTAQALYLATSALAVLQQL